MKLPAYAVFLKWRRSTLDFWRRLPKGRFRFEADRKRVFRFADVFFPQWCDIIKP
jgi:hypothetical protein